MMNERATDDADDEQISQLTVLSKHTSNKPARACAWPVHLLRSVGIFLTRSEKHAHWAFASSVAFTHAPAAIAVFWKSARLCGPQSLVVVLVVLLLGGLGRVGDDVEVRPRSTIVVVREVVVSLEADVVVVVVSTVLLLLSVC